MSEDVPPETLAIETVKMDGILLIFIGCWVLILSASNVPYLIIAPFLLVIFLITRNLNYSTSGFHGALPV